MDVCRRPQIVFTNTLLCTTTDLRLDYCIIIMIVLQTRKKKRTSVTSVSKQLLLLCNRDLFKESVLHSRSKKKPIEQQKQTLPAQRRKKKKKRKKDCRSGSFFSSRMMISTSSDDVRCTSSKLSLSHSEKKTKKEWKTSLQTNYKTWKAGEQLKAQEKSKHVRRKAYSRVIIKSSTPRRRPPAAAAEERSATRRARSEEAHTETMPAESWNRHKTTKAKRRPRWAGPEREGEREKEIARSEKEIVNYGWTNKTLVAI